MSNLFITHRSDVHAFAVRWGLRRLGADADIFCMADFPQKVTGAYDSLARRYQLTGPGLDHQPYDLIWNRRAGPVTLHPSVHQADRRMATNIGARFLRAFADVDRRATWINAHDAADQIERKIVQLELAQDAGFDVPETLFSNDFDQIRAFVREHQCCIVKPSTIMSWETSAHWVSMTTTRVSVADLWDRVAVEACPMIYQREVEKATELRLVVFGEDVTCVEIDSQNVQGAELDWRIVPHKNLRLQERPCPSDLCDKVLRFMKSAGLRHGSFDLIVDPQGRAWFLEINQQGQFLWIEDTDTDIRMLERASQFILSGGDPAFKARCTTAPDLSYRHYVDSGQAERDLNKAFHDHVADLDTLTVVEEPRRVEELT